MLCRFAGCDGLAAPAHAPRGKRLLRAEAGPGNLQHLLVGRRGIRVGTKPDRSFVTEADRAHSREKLAALLWPDMSDQAARSNLRYALSNLRKAIGDAYASEPFLCISKQTVQLNLDGNLDVDVLTFSRQLAQSPSALSHLEEAIRVYQGDFLDGFYIGSDSAFEEWVVLKREQLRRQALETLHRLAQTYRENGDLANALSAAWRLVDLEPWSEESHRELMLLLGLSGRRAAALSQYETCRRLLAQELNVEPSIETTHIYEQIRDGQIYLIGAHISPYPHAHHDRPAPPTVDRRPSAIHRGTHRFPRPAPPSPVAQAGRYRVPWHPSCSFLCQAHHFQRATRCDSDSRAVWRGCSRRGDLWGGGYSSWYFLTL